jgi:CBS domain containing-hemolysin-like protein
MTAGLLFVGLLLAAIGAAGAAAMVTTARSELAEAVSRRLRGAEESFAWLEETERLVVVAMSVGALGLVLVGASTPGLFSRLTVLQLAAVILVVIVPAALGAGYVLPRWLTRTRAERVVASVRPPLAALHTVLQFVLPGGERAVSDGVDALAREGSATGLRTGDELAMVGGVMSFAERPIRHVMTPRTEVVSVPSDAPRGEVLRVFAESGYTRLPVTNGSLDEIVGMVHAFDLFKLGDDDPLPLRPVVHAPESRNAADLLVDMQRERRHFAVVLDEFGGTAGIVTLENLLEALVGEITDEDDALEPAPAALPELLEVDGADPATEVADHFGVTLPEAVATSFAGLLVERLGRIPRVGERFRIATLDIDVVAATPARVERMVVRRRTPAAVPLDPESSA